MSKVDNRGIKIYLDTTNYKQGINEIVSQTEKYKKKLEDLEKSGKGTTLAAQKLRSEISKLQQQEKEHRGQLKETERILNNLSGVTYNELIAVKRKLQNELRLEQRGTEQYNTTLRQYKRVCTEITLAQKEMNIEIGCQGTAWGKTANFINKYIGLAGTVLGMITGISLKLNQLREKRNEREDVKADVQALTGLSEESIGWLKQQAIRLSTTVTESGIRIRQSATEIMDAYKLVGSAKPELLSNKEALAAVTEQTLILASASGMTLKDAVDAVTLSLNQYGDGADQAARYANVMAAGSKYGSAAVESVTKSIKSSGVAAASANIPIEQLVGTIETLGEKGIKDEIAGTGLKRFFLTLQTGADDTNPKIVGLETALDNLQKKQLSATKIKKMFGEEGYNVASVLINEAEKVKYYTEAVTGTSVAMEQAATKSDTAAAKLAQAKNKMNEMGIELMEKLNPAIISVMNSTTSWTGKLVDLISFLGKHSSAIITLTTIIGIYIAALKLENFWTAQTTVASKEYIAMQKLRLYWDKIVTASTLIYTAVTATLTGNLKAAKVAMKELFLIMKLSPFALIASLIVGVIAVSYKWNKAIRERYDIQKTMNKLHEKSAKLYEEEKEQVGKLWNTIHDGNKSLDERRTAITKLQEIMPEYRAQINEEGKVINETTTKLDDMNAALNRNIKLKTLREELFDRYKSIEKLERSPALKDNSLMGSMAREDVRTKIADEKKVLEALKKEYSAVFSEKFKKKKPEMENGTTTTVTPTGGNNDEDKLKKQLEEEKRIYTQEQVSLKEKYLENNNKKLQDEKLFQKEMERIQLEHLKRSLKIVGEESQEGIDIQNQINDLKIKQQKEHTQELIDQEKIDYERQQQELKELYASGKDENLNSEAAYNDAMEQLTVMHLERMLEIAGLNAEQRKQVEKQLLDYKVKCIQKDQKANEQNSKNKLKTDKQEFEERLRIYQQYGEEFGNALGNIISGQENAMQGFADTMIDIMFDVIAQIINAELVNLGIIGTAEAAKATAKEIGSKGFWGIASGAILAGLITAGIATAKSTLKGFIGKRRDSGSSPTESTPQAEYKINQRAAGKYDVIGAEDGRSYHDIPYIGEAPTGIVKRTSLISENGSELIINSEDLSRLQKHINYPVVLQAINDARSGRVPQYAEGSYDSISHSTDSPTPPSPNNNLEAKLEKVMDKMDQVMDKLGKPSKNYVLLSDINDAEEIKLKSEKPFTRGDQ